MQTRRRSGPIVVPLMLVAGCVVAGTLLFAQQGEKDRAATKAAKAPENAARAKETRQQKFQSLRQDYGERIENVQDEIDELEVKLAELGEKRSELSEEYLAKLMTLLETDPQDDVAFAAIEEALFHRLEDLSEDQADMIFATLTKHHVASEKASSICQFAAELELNEPILAFLKAVIAKNPHPEAKAWALFALATAKYAEADAENDPKLFKEAEQLFDRVVKTIPADHTAGTPVDAAERFLFELRHLMAGNQAPDFETEDLNGRRVKLSDHRGKVVLLEFWATWCNYSAELLPQQKKLAKEYAGRPLTLISVSGDDEASDVTEFLVEHPLPWVHWWNGPDGGVLDAWNVQAFPTLYLIDAQGKIRYRNIQGEELEKAVERLVKEAEQASTKTREP